MPPSMPPSAPASAKARDAMLRETRALIVETVKFDGMAWFRFDFAELNVDKLEVDALSQSWKGAKCSVHPRKSRYFSLKSRSVP
jgi:hypothetical protein